MDTLQFLVTVFLILLKCEESTMQNLTFYNTPKTWKYAANFCSHKGGVLESNVTLLMELDEFKSADEDVWIGKFKTLTKWTYIQGCYSINETFQHFKLESYNTLELQCQMLCEEYQFYSIKEDDCYCISNISSFVRITNCNCDGCYKVWEHQLPKFGSAKKDEKCIAAKECGVQGKLIRSYETCAKNYHVTCDNGAELGYTHGNNYHAAAEECESQGSFIKWYSDSLCVATSFPQYWTSGTRYTETFLLRKPYFTENLQPEECYILTENGGEGKKNCNEDLRFVCRFENDEDEGNMISIPNLSTSPQKRVQSDDSGSIAAGTVTSIIVVIAVISVLVFIYRRRLSRKKPTSHESQNNSRLQDTAGLPSNHEISKAPIYHEIDTDNFGLRSGNLNCSRTVNNITYDQSPNSKNMNQSANSSVVTNFNSIEHQRKFGQTEYDMPKVINVTGSSSEGNYCLAEPIATNTEEELDPYDINKDYDHLNNVMKKEDPITKVYDHLPTTVTDDPTYDHSNLKSALDNEDFYDHFKNEEDND